MRDIRHGSSFQTDRYRIISISKRYTRADFNGDGDISRREFLGSLEQFARLDADQNGYVNSAEAAAFEAN
jgi:hypothetical protein